MQVVVEVADIVFHLELVELVVVVMGVLHQPVSAIQEHLQLVEVEVEVDLLLLVMEDLVVPES
jgi:hypothetical protein